MTRRIGSGILALAAGCAAMIVAVAMHSAKAAEIPKDPKAAGPAGGSVTFSKDVAPIVFDNCVKCHRPGEVAPFSLTSYTEVKKQAKQIAEVTQTKQMPPWKAMPQEHKFIGERRLTDAQVQTLSDWAKAGAPEGDASATPALPKFAPGWALGEPDVIVKMPKAFKVHSEGADVFRWFVLPMKLTEDKYVRAVEFRPGNPKIVHHTLFFLDSSGKARTLEKPGQVGWESRGPGFTPSGGLGGWAPGVTPQELPTGIARLVPKGSDLVLQTHFHPSGKEEEEQSSVGLYFAKEKPQKLLTILPQAARPLDIPAGEKNYVASNTFTVPMDVTLQGIIPHAHLLCTSIKATATPPTGPEETLIDIKNWDWDWQEHYTYQEPIHIPAGTKVRIDFTYDNSTDNIKNPSTPPKRVRWGEQTQDEMALVFFQILTDVDGPLAAFQRGGGGAGSGANGGGGGLKEAALKRYDKNGNGKLDPDEIAEARKDLLGGRGGNDPKK